MSKWYETFFDGLYMKVLGRHFEQSRSKVEAKLAKRLLKLRKGQRILDLPCGMGRISLPLARLGLDVVGVDLTRPYIRKARREARKAGLDAQFIRQDMREIDFDREFHAVLNWFGSFGYFSDKDNLRFSRAAFRALRPGGRFLIETIGKSWCLSHFRSKDSATVAGIKLYHRRRYDPRRSRVYDKWTMEKGKTRENHEISIRLYDAREMRRLLRQAGFAEVEFFGRTGDCRPTRFTRHSRRMIAVAEKGN
jgi:cyclopropane fatty-acyl-phospholipid synthase-like methyltransferase